MALTREQELSLAQNRIIAGQGSKTDEANLDYAKDFVKPVAGKHFNKIQKTNSSGLTAQEMVANTGKTSGASNSNLTPTDNPYSGDMNFTPKTEEEIRQETLEQMQRQIDSINSGYDALLEQERVYGEDRAGRTRASSARGGLLGSSFGAMREDKTRDYNAQQERLIEADRAAAISAVYKELDRRADEKYDAELSRAKGAVDDYEAWLDKTKTATRNDLALLASNGVDAMDVDDVKEWAELAGFDYDEETGQSFMLDAWMNANKPKEQQVEYDFYKLDDGTFMRTDSNGNTTNMGNFAVPEGATLKEWDGMLYAVTKNEDGSLSMSPMDGISRKSSGGSGGGQDDEEWDSDIKKYTQELRSGTTWGSAWSQMYNKYKEGSQSQISELKKAGWELGVSPENLDVSPELKEIANYNNYVRGRIDQELDKDSWYEKGAYKRNVKGAKATNSAEVEEDGEVYVVTYYDDGTETRVKKYK